MKQNFFDPAVPMDRLAKDLVIERSRLKFILDSSQVLVSSFDSLKTLGVIAKLAVPA